MHKEPSSTDYVSIPELPIYTWGSIQGLTLSTNPFLTRLHSNQVNDEISRQIFDDLDKQLDAQMMAELEKCQEEQSRRMDDELDRQVFNLLYSSFGYGFRSWALSTCALHHFCSPVFVVLSLLELIESALIS